MQKTQTKLRVRTALLDATLRHDQGGTAVNITAKHCDFVTDIRTLPHEDPYTYFNDYVAFVRNAGTFMQAISPEAHIDIEVHASVPGLNPHRTVMRSSSPNY